MDRMRIRLINGDTLEYKVDPKPADPQTRGTMIKEMQSAPSVILRLEGEIVMIPKTSILSITISGLDEASSSSMDVPGMVDVQRAT